MKKVLIGLGSLLVAVMLFTAGAMANEWLSYTGDDSNNGAKSDVDEIMNILEQTNQDLITTEQAYQGLLDLNPSGLAKQNKELRGQVSDLEDEVANLTASNDQLQIDLDEANASNEDLKGTITQLTEDKEQLESEVGTLKEEKTQLQGTIDLRDHTITGLEGDVESLESQLEDALANQADQEYITHLEEQLRHANERADEVKGHTGEALQRAEELVGE